MPSFHYEAFTASGSVTTGAVEAETVSAALDILRQRGLSPYSTQPHKPKSKLTSQGKFGSLKWQAETSQQLATLIGAGISIDRAFGLLAATARLPVARKCFEEILASISTGKPLSTALSEGSMAFPPEHLGVLHATEGTGKLADGFAELAAVLNRKLEFRNSLLSALLYPAFLVILAPISLLIISFILVPNLTPIFVDSGAPMPLALRAMAWVEGTIRSYWMYILAVGVLTSVLVATNWPKITPQIARISRKLPFLKEIDRRLTLIRLTRTLGTLLRAGFSLQTALQRASAALPQPTDKAALADTERSVSSGKSLAKSIANLRFIDPAARQMIAIGEETNSLDKLLLHVADKEEKALTVYIQGLQTLISPLLTLFVGVMIGGIVVSIMQAILSVNQLAVQ